MPYIKQDARCDLDYFPASLTRTPASTGELNYVLTQVIEKYRADFGDSYQTFAEIEAALQHVSKEFYRRVVAPYEDHKMVENGDVFRAVKRA